MKGAIGVSIFRPVGARIFSFQKHMIAPITVTILV